MKTFTIGELSGQPDRVFEVVDQEGEAALVAADGRRYRLIAPPSVQPRGSDFRFRKVGTRTSVTRNDIVDAVRDGRERESDWLRGTIDGKAAVERVEPGHS